MKVIVIFAVTFFGLSSTVWAESFVCSGSGKFSAIKDQTVVLEWKMEKSGEEPTNQKVLFYNSKMSVRAYIDKSNSDSNDHSLGLEVLEKSGTNGVEQIYRGAKGAIDGMVQYIDGNSVLLCLPISS